jgi:hypothetical protein
LRKRYSRIMDGMLCAASIRELILFLKSSLVAKKTKICYYVVVSE